MKSGGLCHIIACDEDSSSMLLQCICKIDYLILYIHIIYTYIYTLHTSKYLFVFESQNSCSHQSKNARSSGVTENCSWDQAHDKNSFVELKMFMSKAHHHRLRDQRVCGKYILDFVKGINSHITTAATDRLQTIATF